MPQIGLIATIAATVTTNVVLATAIYFGVVAVAYTGIAIGLSYLSRAVFGQRTPDQSTPEDVQQSLRQGIQPRIRHYGRVKAAGPWLFGASDAGNFHKVTAIAHGEIDAIEELWIDDNEVTLDGAGLVTSAPYDSKVQLKTRLGTASQTAFSELVSTFADYTDAHRGKGIAMIYAKQLAVAQGDYHGKFPNGINTLYRAVLRGAKIWNPKTQVTEWDDNGASVIRDFLTHPDGMRLPSSIFTTTRAQAGWEAAFDECAESVSLKAGGTEEQFRLWGSYRLTERPGDVLHRMLACVDGAIVPTSDGGWALQITTGGTPSVTLDEDSILEVIELTRGLDRQQRPNTIRAEFLDAAADYGSGDADAWVDAADVTARGTEPEDVSFLMSPSHGQTRRLMKRRYHRRNPGWVMRVTTNMKGLACVGEEAVTIRLVDFGIDERFEIQKLEFNFGTENDEVILEGVTLDLIAMPASVFTWDAASEEGTKPVTTSVDETSTIPVPTGLTLTFRTSTLTLDVDANAPPSDALELEYRIKPTSGSDWSNFAPAEGETLAVVSGLVDGTQYDVQARHVSFTGARGDWTSSAQITITTDTTAPADVTLNAATGGSGQVTLNWDTPNAANFNRTVIKRGTTNVEGDATEIGASPVYGTPNTTYEIVDSGLAADDYYYWLYAQNGSGVDDGSGVASGSVTVT